MLFTTLLGGGRARGGVCKKQTEPVRQLFCSALMKPGLAWRMNTPLLYPPLLRFHIWGWVGQEVPGLAETVMGRSGVKQGPVGTAVPAPFPCPRQSSAGIPVCTMGVSPEHSPGIPLALSGLELSPGVCGSRMFPWGGGARRPG